MDELEQRVWGYAEQALRELVEEGPTSADVEVIGVECRRDAGGGEPAACKVSFARRPAPIVTVVEFTPHEGDDGRRADVDEIKRIFKKKVFGS